MSLRTKAAAATDFQELGRYLARTGGVHKLLISSVSWATGQNQSSLRRLAKGNKNAMIAGFEHVIEKNHILFFPLIRPKSALALPNARPETLVGSLLRLLAQFESDIGEKVTSEEDRYSLVLADFCFVICPELQSMNISTASSLAILSALQFLGKHSVAIQVTSFPSFETLKSKRDLWPELRGVPGSAPDLLPGAQRQFVMIEKGHLETMIGLRNKTAKQTAKGFLFYMRLVVLPCSALLILLTALCRPARRRGWMKDLEQLSEHWELSSGVLVHFWTDVGKCVTAASQLLQQALRTRNPYAVIRALDWWLFTSSHLGGLGFSIFLYKILARAASSHAPFLWDDIRMHQGILYYYKGDFAKSLMAQADAEIVLCRNEHPFNRVINLSNALRTSVNFENSILAHLIHGKLLQNEAFQHGLQPYRTLLAMSMQWAREDGVGSHISEILEGYEQLKTQPYFIRGTSELLLSMAFLEMKNLMLAEKFLNAAEETLRLVNSSYVFNSYFKKIRTEIGTPSEVPILASASTLSPDFENLIRLKFGVVQTERLSVLQSEISDHLLTATTPLSDDDFAKKFREDLQFTLPEFRVAIRATDKWQHHDGTPLPLTSNAIEQLFGSALVDQVSSVSFCAQNGRAWQGFLVRVENGMSMLIAAPYIASQHYNRLILGEQFSDLFLIGALRRRIQSDRQRLEQQKNLLAQQAQLTDLAAQVAHDIRSPLSALRIIADRAGLASDQNEHVSLLKQSVMRISDIANDLLVRSRIRPVAFIDRTNRYRVVDAIMPLLEEKKALLLSRPGITIGQDVTERSEEICTTVSESDLKRALSNVINNAMEAIAEKVDSCGRITVSLRLYSSFFAISVEDDGIGIDAEVLPLLGTRGFSISKVASCASKGSGLGLAHARALCESAQGRLQIQSKLGFGTIVTLVLPVEQQYLI